MPRGAHGENGANAPFNAEQMVHKRDLGIASHQRTVDILVPHHRNLIHKLAIMDHAQ